MTNLNKIGKKIKRIPQELKLFFTVYFSHIFLTYFKNSNSVDPQKPLQLEIFVNSPTKIFGDLRKKNLVINFLLIFSRKIIDKSSQLSIIVQLRAILFKVQ